MEKIPYLARTSIFTDILYQTHHWYNPTWVTSETEASEIKPYPSASCVSHSGHHKRGQPAGIYRRTPQVLGEHITNIPNHLVGGIKRGKPPDR